MKNPWERISSDDIQKLPPIQFHGTISLIETPETLIQALENLLNEEMVGLDTEKRPTFKKGQNYPLSLLQLATHTHTYLIQLQKTGFIPHLMDFLSNEKIKKIGIALHDDIKELKKLGSFNPKGFIQLDILAKEKGILQTGARSLTARFMGRRLSKSSQKSNWGRLDLTQKQKIYAATDAWICLQIYPLLLSFEKLTLTSTPPLPPTSDSSSL